MTVRPLTADELARIHAERAGQGLPPDRVTDPSALARVAAVVHASTPPAPAPATGLSGGVDGFTGATPSNPPASVPPLEGDGEPDIGAADAA